MGQDTEALTTILQELRDAHAQLHESHERFQRIARTIPCVLYDFVRSPDGDGRFLYLSARCEEFFEIKPEKILEKPARFWKMLHPDDLARVTSQYRAEDETRELFETELRLITPSGRTKWIRFSSLPNAAQPGERTVWSGFMFDVTERKLMEQEVQRLATTDSLTGIANRRQFLQQLHTELEQFRRSGNIAALLMMDLDRFKLINDSYGHAAGDAVLKHFAAVIGQNLRSTDAFGRLGGEEFALLLPETRLAGAMEFAAHLCQIVATSPVEDNERSIHVTTSIGVTEFLPGESGPESIMARADSALYSAKQRGRNQVVVF